MKSKPIIDPYSNDSFKELENHWYGKIQASGFDDIEDYSKKDRPLKSWHNFKFKSIDHAVRGNSEDYYANARTLLLSYSFKTDTHKRIWELHCEGLSHRKIETKIQTSDLKKKYKREQILNIIRYIAEEIKF